MIRLENVSERYKMSDIQVSALANVSLTIDKGEFVVVPGPLSSGQTIPLNILPIKFDLYNIYISHP